MFNHHFTFPTDGDGKLIDFPTNYTGSFTNSDEAKKELAEITQSVKAIGFGRIICTDAIHPGTMVVIGDANLSIKDALSNASLYYEEDAVCIGSAR
jgi:hypothetical protein